MDKEREKLIIDNRRYKNERDRERQQNLYNQGVIDGQTKAFETAANQFTNTVSTLSEKNNDNMRALVADSQDRTLGFVGEMFHRLFMFASSSRQSTQPGNTQRSINSASSRSLESGGNYPRIQHQSNEPYITITYPDSDDDGKKNEYASTQYRKRQ